MNIFAGHGILDKPEIRIDEPRIGDVLVTNPGPTLKNILAAAASLVIFDIKSARSHLAGDMKIEIYNNMGQKCTSFSGDHAINIWPDPK